MARGMKYGNPGKSMAKRMGKKMADMDKDMAGVRMTPGEKRAVKMKKMLMAKKGKGTSYP